jgi:hypothetical protein
VDYSKMRQGVTRSNKRLKVGTVDMDLRAELAAERRTEKMRRAYEKRVRQEKEDRERYMIPEFQDLEELLTTQPLEEALHG